VLCGPANLQLSVIGKFAGNLSHNTTLCEQEISHMLLSLLIYNGVCDHIMTGHKMKMVLEFGEEDIHD